MKPLVLGLGVPELLIILAVVLLLFGGSRLAGLGKINDFVAKSGTLKLKPKAKTGLSATTGYVSLKVNPDEAVEGDETRVDGNFVGTAAVCNEPCRAGKIDAAVRDSLAIAPDGRKIGGQQQVVNEDRFALQAIRLNAADFDRACGARRSRDLGVYARFIP